MDLANRPRARRALGGPFDLFHPTYYKTYFLGKLDRPFVITVHDMVHEIFDSTRIRDDGTARNKRILCQHASRIIAVSNNTKNDLCRLLGVPAEKIAVIHHGTNLRYRGEPRLHTAPYILYVGARGGYKNFGTFLSAAASLARRHGVDILCAGGGQLTAFEKRSIDSLGLAGRMRHVPAGSSGELSSLYHFASVFCYPSLYEGFGLPLLEAFACGCPVAASATSSIPEVAGNAAEYFDPNSPDAIADRIERILLDPDRSAQLVSAGADRLRAFSWEKSARQTYAVYREALN
jgi:glycosyltransferase involved in cell wall biosynthesis